MYPLSFSSQLVSVFYEGAKIHKYKVRNIKAFMFYLGFFRGFAGRLLGVFFILGSFGKPMVRNISFAAAILSSNIGISR
jgi:hypothetical protein